MKKTIFLLNINDFAPQVTRLTYPLIKCYADRIGAEIEMITERKFPDWPVTYEKLQIYERAKEGWSIYIDSDTLIHPEFLDITRHLDHDTVACYGKDVADIRWKNNEYFERDGRAIGWGNFMAVASDLCLDLWQPLDIPLQEALSQIYPTPVEISAGVTREHLIDDYTLSRNVARYGLKHKTFKEIYAQAGLKDVPLSHPYLIQSPDAMAESHQKMILDWKLTKYVEKWS